MFALLMEPYAMIQVSILLSVMYQMGKNVTSMFDFYVSLEHLAATRRNPVEKHWCSGTGTHSHTFYVFVCSAMKINTSLKTVFKTEFNVLLKVASF